MKRYFSSIKQYSWILLACVVIAASGGYMLAKSQPPTYAVNATLIVHAGAVGTTIQGVSVNTTDSVSEAADYAAEIPTRSVMEFVYNYDPVLKERGYRADDLTANITAATSTTTSAITLTATTTKPADSVLLVNDVANGFQAYKLKAIQDQLATIRQSLQDQYSSYKSQSDKLEQQILQYANPADPHIALLNTDRSDIIHTMDTIQAQILQLPSSVRSDVFVIQLAKLSDVAASTKTTTIVAATAGLGLLLGLLVMALVIFLDDRLRTEEQVKEKLGLAYLGALCNSKEIQGGPTRLSGTAMQQVADICANLRLTKVLPVQWHAPQGAALLVTSPQVAEGKTAIAAALATVVAHGGGTVVVVDGNLGRPSTHLAFGMSAAGMGLSGLLKGMGQAVDDAVLRSNIPGVWLLPVGAPIDDASFLLDEKMPAILAQLRKKTDLVIIDGPALLSGAAASQFAAMVDGVALVADARNEKVPTLLRARELLTSMAQKPSGIILNRFALGRRNRYYATVAPAEKISEQWVSIQAQAGTQTGNGKKQEVVAATIGADSPAVKVPTPFPTAVVPRSPARGLPPDGPMMLVPPPATPGRGMPFGKMEPDMKEDMQTRPYPPPPASPHPPVRRVDAAPPALPRPGRDE